MIYNKIRSLHICVCLSRSNNVPGDDDEIPIEVNNPDFPIGSRNKTLRQIVPFLLNFVSFKSITSVNHLYAGTLFKWKHFYAYCLFLLLYNIHFTITLMVYMNWKRFT